LYTLWIPGEEHLHEVYSDFLKVLSFRLRKNAETISHSKISHKAIIDNLRCILWLLNFEVVWVAEQTTHYVFRVFARLCRLQPPTQNFLFIALSEFLVNFRIHTYNHNVFNIQQFLRCGYAAVFERTQIDFNRTQIDFNRTQINPAKSNSYRTHTEFVFSLPN
jgi:hypothetical protein